jgi:hypothetical protein
MSQCGNVLLTIRFFKVAKFTTLTPLSLLASCTDYTGVIISSKNFDDFSTMSNILLSHMSKWFTSNKLVLNLDKSNILKFTV